jgi:cysteine desulfurase
MFFNKKKKRIYLDFASTTPVRKEVQKVMQPYFSNFFGNAGSIHQEGQIAHNAIERSRIQLSQILRVRPEGIVFTASGTESNNLAILGTIRERHAQGVAYADMEVIATAIEHASVREVLLELQTWGVVIKYVRINEEGMIDGNSLKENLTKNTVLVTFAYANSEIGVVQQVGKLARIIKSAEGEFHSRIYIHIDAAQAPLWLPCTLDSLMVDMLSLDASKCYGPKGVGILAMRHGVTLKAYSFGGSQERGLRPGTENTPAIVGAVEALRIAQEGYKTRSEKVSKLRDTFIQKLETIEGIAVNGSREYRIANNVNISILGVESEFAVITLDEAGIACSTKSACGGAHGDGSSVVLTLTGDIARSTSTLRFSLGEETTMRDIEYVVFVLAKHVQRTREVQQKLT